MFIELLVITGALISAAASASVEKVSLTPKVAEKEPPVEAIDELIEGYLPWSRSPSEESTELQDTANEPTIVPVKAGVTRAVDEVIVPKHVDTTPDGGKRRPATPPYKPPASIQPFARDASKHVPPEEAIDKLVAMLDEPTTSAKASKHDPSENAIEQLAAMLDGSSKSVEKPSKSPKPKEVKEKPIVPTRIQTTPPDGGKGHPLPPYTPPESIQPFARDICSRWKCEPYNKKYLKTNLIADYEHYTYCLDVCEPLLIGQWMNNWLRDLTSGEPVKDLANEPLIVPVHVNHSHPEEDSRGERIRPYNPPASIQPFARDICRQWKCEPHNKKYLKTHLIDDYEEYTDCLDVCEPLLIKRWLKRWIEDLVKAQLKDRRHVGKEKIAISKHDFK
ncbi:hypothetical protein M514_07011 [Trichuris suis]|uniref:Secreted protein n=1 Tax=Trichuris suis TaxID=68888 RepID=A0A085N6U9_9BILA|nr:hypothetical protein M514_07011 [Trichuris suis]